MSREDRGYETVEDLIANETNGWLAVAIITGGKKTWPYVEGPFDNKRDAVNAKNKMRRAFNKAKVAGQLQQTYTFHVRPLWKPDN